MVAARFLTVGLTCASLHNVILIAGHALGLHYVAASIVSFAIVVVVGYALHSAWTFPGAKRGRTSFVRYALSMSANFPLFVAGLFVLVDLAGLPVPMAAPAVTVAMFAFNFFATRLALRA
jgi:putative flippase GtrA